jgi:hypothetical protein
MAYKGRFLPKNPQKYKGDPSNIIYRSRWELLLMSHLDDHPDVIQWSSEEFFIPYKSPVDGKWHRYFPDFYVKKKTPQNKIEVEIIEVKPAVQTVPPVIKETKTQKPSRRYINEVMTWGINSAKWKAARDYCQNRGWTFRIFTEKELGIKF